MKLFFAILIAMSAVSSVKDGAALLFYEKSFSFPDTMEGELLSHQFKFKNDGGTPLLIQSYKVGCSCTRLEFSKAPILPSSEGVMTVYFDTNQKYGYQNRIVEVYSNDGKKPKKIRIKVNVIPKGYN